MGFLYRIYQLLIVVPIALVLTVLTALTVVIGCSLGGGHFWGYYPGRWWSRCLLWLLLIPVKVEGRENMAAGQSYVFVANHQGAFDIFLIYGYLGRNFKWMMKESLRRIPLVGWACAKSHQIFVDKRGASRIRKTYDDARRTLQGGTSVTVFPEGRRTFTGQMGPFSRGAFALADELQMPVVPMTINGSFHIMPRTRDFHFVRWHRLRLTIHKPIPPSGQGPDNIQATMTQARDAIAAALQQ